VSFLKALKGIICQVDIDAPRCERPGLVERCRNVSPSPLQEWPQNPYQHPEEDSQDKANQKRIPVKLKVLKEIRHQVLTSSTRV
jgi:hypothetical protein